MTCQHGDRQTAGLAGGVATTIGVGGGTATPSARNVVLAGNTASTAPDCSVASGFSESGPVVLGTGTSCNPGGANVVRSATPGLGPLQGNGGPTETHALLPGSPAIDAGNAACVDHLGAALAADQRGNARSDGKCDAGAYEAP